MNKKKVCQMKVSSADDYGMVITVIIDGKETDSLLLSNLDAMNLVGEINNCINKNK